MIAIKSCVSFIVHILIGKQLKTINKKTTFLQTVVICILMHNTICGKFHLSIERHVIWFWLARCYFDSPWVTRLPCSAYRMCVCVCVCVCVCFIYIYIYIYKVTFVLFNDATGTHWFLSYRLLDVIHMVTLTHFLERNPLPPHRQNSTYHGLW